MDYFSRLPAEISIQIISAARPVGLADPATFNGKHGPNHAEEKYRVYAEYRQLLWSLTLVSKSANALA